MIEKIRKSSPLENQQNRIFNAKNPISQLLDLLPHFNDQTPTQLLKEVTMHCDSFTKNLFNSIESLGEFLNISAMDNDIGSIGKTEICNMAHHIKMLGHLGYSVHELGELAREELKKRGVSL